MLGCCIALSDVSNIIAAFIASLAALLGVFLSFKQWKEEKKNQREHERKVLLTRIVGKCFGNLDYVVFQYRKFKKKCEKASEKTKQTLFEQLQSDTEQYVKEAEELMNEAEVMICNDELITQLQNVGKNFVDIVSICSKESNDLDEILKKYSDDKNLFIKSANLYIYAPDIKSSKYN